MWGKWAPQELQDYYSCSLAPNPSTTEHFNSWETFFSLHSSSLPSPPFLSRLQDVIECCLWWFYIIFLRLPAIRFQWLVWVGSPPPAPQSKDQPCDKNTGLIRKPQPDKKGFIVLGQKITSTEMHHLLARGIIWKWQIRKIYLALQRYSIMYDYVNWIFFFTS